ncbi:glycosyltransferase family 39 protein [Lysobacter sp. D1-1-M9]|uniref:glycosyltransferase family 39 protein n=1 Tax=Novilysobacter longmucuonensis TaxID=3098603 RepID=UPI002FCA3B7A
MALCLVTLALLVRTMAAFLLADVSGGASTWEYGQQGLCALQTDGDLCMRDRTGAPYASAYMPPLTSYLWLGLFSLLGDGAGARTAYIALNVLVGALGPGLLYLFARRAGLGRITAGAGALVLCFYPTFVFVSTTYHATNFTVALLLAFALILVRALRSGEILPALAAGLVCGIAVLTRSEMLLVGAGAGLLLLWRYRVHWRTALLSAAALAIGAALVVTPWAIRNYVVFERVILVANANDYNLWKAFGPYAQGSGNQVGTAPESLAAIDSIRDGVPLGDAPGARYENRVQDAFAEDTSRFMGRLGATHLITLTAQKVALLWLFDWTDPLTHGFLYWAPWLVVNALAVAGAFLMARGRSERLNADGAAIVFLLLAVLTFSYAISGVHARYRMHLEPVLFLFAGVALQALLAAVRRARA